MEITYNVVVDAIHDALDEAQTAVDEANRLIGGAEGMFNFNVKTFRKVEIVPIKKAAKRS